MQYPEYIHKYEHFTETIYRKIVNDIMKTGEYIIEKLYEHNSRGLVYNVCYLTNFGRIFHGDYHFEDGIIIKGASLIDDSLGKEIEKKDVEMLKSMKVHHYSKYFRAMRVNLNTLDSFFRRYSY